MSDASIAFNELVPGAEVRFTKIDGIPYLSVRDIIAVVCGQNKNRSAEIWRELPESRMEEVFVITIVYFE